jgi:hypothetical protein
VAAFQCPIPGAVDHTYVACAGAGLDLTCKGGSNKWLRKQLT